MDRIDVGLAVLVLFGVVGFACLWIVVEIECAQQHERRMERERRDVARLREVREAARRAATTATGVQRPVEAHSVDNYDDYLGV